MTTIENPFAGHEVGADFAWHKSRGYQGGTDYKVGPDVTVRAACDGVVHRLSPSEIALDYGPSRFINYRELKKLVGSFPRTVKRGETIGITGNEWGGIVRWPHIDRTVNGVRVPFEPVVNAAISKPAQGGTAVPIAPEPAPTLTLGDPDMFQYRNEYGTRWFVHPNDTVRDITPDEWSGNVAVGIPTKTDVPNAAGNRFRRAHDKRVRRLFPPVDGGVKAVDIIEGVLDGLGLSDDLAADVADAVYAKIKKGGVTLTTVGVNAVAVAMVSELTNRLTK